MWKWLHSVLYWLNNTCKKYFLNLMTLRQMKRISLIKRGTAWNLERKEQMVFCFTVFYPYLCLLQLTKEENKALPKSDRTKKTTTNWGLTCETFSSCSSFFTPRHWSLRMEEFFSLHFSCYPLFWKCQIGNLPSKGITSCSEALAQNIYYIHYKTWPFNQQ